MNIMKLYAPDVFTGRVLVWLEKWVSMALMLLRRPSRRSLHLAALIKPIKPAYTMVKNANLVMLYQLVERINGDAVPGDIVECGVWNGGSAALMARAQAESGGTSGDRLLHLFDSFQGLPPPGQKDGELERRFYHDGWNKGDAEKVKRVMARLGVPEDRFRTVPGWFTDTLQDAGVQQIALLHVDADWYDSVMQVLEAFYDKVAPGGYVVLDDYGSWKGCRRAIHDFLKARDLDLDLVRHSRVGAHFRKPVDSPP